jgi:hypothetical protein
VITVARQITKYKLDMVRNRKSDETGGPLNQQPIIKFSIEIEMRIMNLGRNFLYIRNHTGS